MDRADRAAFAHVAFLVGVWAGLAPGVLVRNADGQLDLTFRNPLYLTLAVILLVGGSALVYYPGRELAAAGAHLFTMRPGPRLVTDGWYGRIRKPQDIGTLMIAVAPAVALVEPTAWVGPLIAAVYVLLGTGLYEDRLLLETFGDEFRQYRRSVPRFVPRFR